MRIFHLLVLLVALLVGCLWAISSRLYGLARFQAIPVQTGAVVVACLDPDSYGDAGVVGSAAGSFLLLFVGFEGLICLFLAVPLTAGCGAVGGLVYRWFRERFASGATAVLLLLPRPAGTLNHDLGAKAPLHRVVTAVEVDAQPAAVWPVVLAFPKVEKPPESSFSGPGWLIRCRRGSKGHRGRGRFAIVSFRRVISWNRLRFGMRRGYWRFA